MTDPERNYDIGDREALAISRALQNWRHWLEATKEPIEIITDHKNLVNFSKPQILKQRQARWLQALQRFNYIIKYRPGDRNSAADALSRRAELEPMEKPREQVLIPAERFVPLGQGEEINNFIQKLQTMVTNTAI